MEAAKVDGSLDKQCCGCSERFSSEEELRAHSEKTHALEPSPSTEARPFQCGICYRWFKSARGVLDHRSDRRNRHYQCATCGQRFSRPSRLAVHENLHSKAKAFACDQCGETFHNLYARRVHIRKSHGGAVKDGPVTTGNECQQCGKSFRSASYLKSHQKLHANEAPHKCTVCGAQFKLPVYLKWHMKIHSGTYSCNHCNLAFKGPFDLREHQNRHIGYKEFVCTSCDKNFYTKKELNKHERRTHERKPKAAKS
ncbi:gastrula zinc finger protein XlCGF7.1-like [Anopheles cruzii]|uniref:gastrula zinc finger protein XlCGF7.1-like n=1 Tax=Anopheles cruzii TaxID=68878 RepID=UPI0022EC523D|nr:gastrula zinc finger protein XlCGF7.1-like [Anopheles cruzii]